MDRKKRLNPESRRAYLEGLRKYREKGVPILIDGKEADESQWDKIFEIREDGSFYMGDYILEDAAFKDSQEGIACESSAEYAAAENGLAGRRLKEIRFDRVYNR